MTVAVAEERDAVGWGSYVDGHPNATVYHRWAWRHVLSEAFAHRPHFLIARRGANVVGILPLVQVRSLLFGHSLSSLPFCPYAGPLADDAVAAAALDDTAQALAEDLRVDHLEYRGFGAAGEGSRGWPVQDLYVTFRKTLSPDHEANLAAIPRKQRAMVRKGIKAGLSADGGDLDTFFELFADNVHRHGTPAHGRRFFALLLEAFGDDAGVLIVRDPHGAPVSGVLSLYFRDEVLPMYAGDTVRARDLAANDF
ncbi:MAG: FemAB family PEP-CTERM system-associated protein, partial [Limnobacter sp.]|nr:FemAB family PEP-CTERM system-associated protein [Limnobacter sp.]